MKKRDADKNTELIDYNPEYILQEMGIPKEYLDDPNHDWSDILSQQTDEKQHQFDWMSDNIEESPISTSAACKTGNRITPSEEEKSGHLRIRGYVYAVPNDGRHNYQDASYPRETFDWIDIAAPFYSCVCDGVTHSSHPKAFADIVSLACGTMGAKAVTEPGSARILGDKWISHQIQEIDAAYPSSNTAEFNAEEKKLVDREYIHHRRAAATLNILEINQDEAVVSSYGDTVCFHIRGNEIIAQNPPLSADEFTNRPHQINTDTDHIPQNQLITSATPIQTGDILLQATDALAQWLVSESSDLPREKRLKLLLSVSSEKEFTKLIEQERKHGRLHDDDTTMLKIELQFNERGNNK